MKVFGYGGLYFCFVLFQVFNSAENGIERATFMFTALLVLAVFGMPDRKYATFP